MAGRPTALTPELQARFVEAIEAGTSIALAAEAVGINRRTAFRWLEQEGDFCIAVESARSRRVYRWLRIIESHAADDWKAAAWLLERTHQEDFGKSIKTAVQEEIQAFLSGLKDKLDSRAWKDVIRIAYDQAGAGAVPRGHQERAEPDH